MTGDTLMARDFPHALGMHGPTLRHWPRLKSMISRDCMNDITVPCMIIINT